MSGHNFDVGFENDVLAQCLNDTDFLKYASRILDAHHFSTNYHSWVWQTVRELWVTFAERATVKILLTRAKRDFPDAKKSQPYLELIAKLKRRKAATPRTSLDEVQRFVRFVTCEDALGKSIKSLEDGDIDNAFETLRKATLKDVRPKAYTAINWIEEFEDRQADRKHRAEHPDEYARLATGIPRLDDLLGGGMMRGEFGMVMGTTGRGKSIFLNHLGFNHIMRGFSGIHFSLEMAAEQVATRYDARFTRMLHRKFKGFDFSRDELARIDRKVKKGAKRYRDKLRIVSMPIRRCDLVTLHNAIEEIRSEMQVDFVIVDSGDHMHANTKMESVRLEQAEVYWGLKTFAEEDDFLCWTSTQAGREWATKKATAEAASESYDKARIVDLALTLNAPKSGSRKVAIDPDDDEETVGGANGAAAGDMDLFVAKYRDGESKLTIPLDTDFSRMMIKEAAAGNDD